MNRPQDVPLALKIPQIKIWLSHISHAKRIGIHRVLLTWGGTGVNYCSLYFLFWLPLASVCSVSHGASVNMLHSTGACVKIQTETRQPARSWESSLKTRYGAGLQCLWQALWLLGRQDTEGRDRREVKQQISKRQSSSQIIKQLKTLCSSRRCSLIVQWGNIAIQPEVTGFFFNYYCFC